MNVCPICLYVNAPTADVCSRCGKFHFVSKAAAVAVADPQADVAEPRTKPDGSPSSLTKPSGVVSVLHAARDPAEETTGGQVAFTLPPRREGAGASSVSGATSRLIVRPRLEVVRGEKLGVSLAVIEGRNVVGRTVIDPVDLDLTGQEPPERVWTSRQHACVIFDGKTVILEDLNSLNGTFVNRQRLFPGQQRVLHPNDVVQVGTVQLRLLISADKVDV